jgi:hypothetical protein
MRLNSYNLTIAIAILLGICLSAGTSSAQDCPTIRIDCSSRTAGNSAPMRCAATVEGEVAGMNPTFLWSISPQVPLNTIPGRPEGMDFDLSSNPNQQFKVTLLIKGFPSDCQNTAQFDSLPEAEASTDEPPPEERGKDDSLFEKQAPPLLPTNSSSIVGTCSEDVVEGRTAFFSAKISDVEQAAKPIYKWTVSRGKIKKGQGTPSIEVDTTDLGGNPVAATARVEGLNAALRVSCTTMIKRVPKAYKLYEISNQSLDEESKQLLRFALRLSIGLEERAFIVAIGRRRQSVEQLKRRAESVRDYLVNQCGVDSSRIMGISIDVGKDEALQLWVVQTGAAPPPKWQE